MTSAESMGTSTAWATARSDTTSVAVAAPSRPTPSPVSSTNAPGEGVTSTVSARACPRHPLFGVFVRSAGRLTVALEGIRDLAWQAERATHHARRGTGSSPRICMPKPKWPRVAAERDVVGGAVLDDDRAARIGRRDWRSELCSMLQWCSSMPPAGTGDRQPARRILEHAPVLELRREGAVLGEQVVARTPLVAAGDDLQAAVLLGGVIQVIITARRSKLVCGKNG